MRRTGRLFEQIADPANLRIAAHKALIGKRAKCDARGFIADLDANLFALRQELLQGAVRVGEYHQFTIFDPKKRLITAPAFRERVLHHAIMNVCEPEFERKLIDDTYACRKGRGRNKCLERASNLARMSGFFLKMDIRRYFDSIRHDILKRQLARAFKDPRLLALLERIIDAFSASPGAGVPIGALTSQHFANYYLGPFDRYIKEKMRIRGYVRYMDDCVILGASAGDLARVLIEANAFLEAELGLALKPYPYINRADHGFDFLGCRVYRNRLVLNRRSKARYRKKLAAIERAFLNGAIGESELQNRSSSLTAFTRTGRVRSCRFRAAVIRSLSACGPGRPSA